MIVTFTVFEKKNPMDPKADANRSAGIKRAGDVTIKSLSRKISKRCTVTHADMFVVSDASLYDRLFPPWAFTHVYGHTAPTGRGGQIFRYKALIIRD